MKASQFEKTYRSFERRTDADAAERAAFHAMSPERRLEVALEALWGAYGDALTQRLEKVCRVVELECG